MSSLAYNPPEKINLPQMQPGYYVLREVLSFRDNAGISFGVVSRAGEDNDGALIVDAETVILPRHQMEQFVGIGLRAREPFIEKIRDVYGEADMML